MNRRHLADGFKQQNMKEALTTIPMTLTMALKNRPPILNHNSISSPQSPQSIVHSTYQLDSDTHWPCTSNWNDVLRLIYIN